VGLPVARSVDRRSGGKALIPSPSSFSWRSPQRCGIHPPQHVDLPPARLSETEVTAKLDALSSA
jgi:hypothetical protein